MKGGGVLSNLAVVGLPQATGTNTQSVQRANPRDKICLGRLKPAFMKRGENRSASKSRRFLEFAFRPRVSKVVIFSIRMQKLSNAFGKKHNLRMQ